MAIVNKTEELRKQRAHKKVFYTFVLMVLLAIAAFIVGIVGQSNASNNINSMKKDITSFQDKITQVEEANDKVSEKIQELKSI